MTELWLEERLDVRPSFEELCRIDLGGTKWYVLGGRLGCSSSRLNDILDFQHDNNTKTRLMFSSWLSNDPHPTRRKLIVELKGMALNKEALDYIRDIGKYIYLILVLVAVLYQWKFPLSPSQTYTVGRFDFLLSQGWGICM